MKTIFTCFLLTLIATNVLRSQDCDSVHIHFITHIYLGGPIYGEWDVEDECLDLNIDEGIHYYPVGDSVFTYHACLDTGEYRARVKVDNFEFQEGMFDFVVEMNGDTLEQENNFEFNEDDLRFNFLVHDDCQPVIMSVNDHKTSQAEVFVQGNMLCCSMVEGGNTELQIFDISGKMMYREVVNGTNKLIDWSAWNSGLYLVNFMESSGELTSLKIVKY
jgi:Secretion system C-terminal sorting domain